MEGKVASIDDRLAVAVAHRNAADIALVDLVAEIVSDDLWAVDGVRHATHFLTWQLGISNAEAHRLIAASTAYSTHPLVMDLFRSGRLTLTQAALATSTAAHRDREVVDLVVACTLNQLRRFVRAMNVADGLVPADEDEPERSEFSFSIDNRGAARGRFHLTPQDREVVQAALDQARAELVDEQKAADGDTAFSDGQRKAVTGADAFLRMAQRSIDAEPVASRRERHRVNIFFDLDTLTNVEHGHDEFRAHYTDGTAAPDWLVSRLLCDGTFTPTFTRNGKPVSVGRSQRIVPDRARRLVLERDHHACRVPWCNNRRRLEVHHVQWWEHGGPTDTSNLASVCEHHHQTIHRGDLRMTGNADDPVGLEFRNRLGNLIRWSPPPPPADPPPPPEPDQPYKHPLGERLLHDAVWINPPPSKPVAA